MTGEALARAIAAELVREGFPRVPAQILLQLMVEPTGTATAAGLADSLGLSPAAVSGGIKYLDVLGFIRIDTVPGSRRHAYSLPAVPWYSSTLMQDRYGPLRALIDAGLADVEAGPARERLSEMSDFFRFLQGEMPRLWERWRASRPADEA
ncbi:GbsR/MarR family transcriptional regulator [uncultured Amnibacterium sp.]|uniref:GbsR/MarR family transcriptional regulator n=1 Tax=uncultured Amnibacterium sp. TaxID=1631851 RepID=UPI0035CB4FDD